MNAEPQYPTVTASDFLVDPSGPWFYEVWRVSDTSKTVWLLHVGRKWGDGGLVPWAVAKSGPIFRKRLNRLFGLTFVSINGKAVVLWGGLPMRAGEA